MEIGRMGERLWEILKTRERNLHFILEQQTAILEQDKCHKRNNG